MIVTESALREQLRRPTVGARVVVPSGATMSPAARDFIGQWQLEVVEQDAAPPGRPDGDRAARDGAAPRPGWDRPAAFPVDRTSEPVCVTCGSTVADKPDHLTQLNASHFVAKTHPRIRLRSRLDAVNATALLVANRARAAGDAETADLVDSVAAYCRELLGAEYAHREAAPLEIGGLDDAALHEATHRPDKVLGIPHLLPASTDPELLLWLNRLRCEVRDAEIVALEAFGNPHDPAGHSIVHGLNRLSSAVYYVALRAAAREGAGEP